MAQDICTYKHTYIRQYLQNQDDDTIPHKFCCGIYCYIKESASNIECLAHIIFHGQT